MDPPIDHMARRHGLKDDDIRHAYRNPIRVLLLDELIMIIGADRSGRLLEVGVLVDEEELIEVIVHAMPARRRFQEWRP
ncbi:MAG: hypothetical protein OXH67_00235 [Acidimicrobiaceae bacterium]|nr:hypothetical protein [Acidimicrobiaceae bacterium]MDE0495489.1 hypothetical protein [Acidimicrobiaceae bacterium]MDE0663992.1 hypothetical protein [Acidimicrobiaceae bacterium]